MKVATSCEPILESNARDFLTRHHGEAALQRTCELVRTCFPELTSIHVELLEDPDEENHTWVVLHILMPSAHSSESIRAQEMHYYEELTQQPPLPYHPFSFALMVDTIRD